MEEVRDLIAYYKNNAIRILTDTEEFVARYEIRPALGLDYEQRMDGMRTSIERAAVMGKKIIAEYEKGETENFEDKLLQTGQACQALIENSIRVYGDACKYAIKRRFFSFAY